MNTSTNVVNVPVYKNLSLNNLEGEIWKPIKYAPNGYEISNLGRVKSFKYKKPRIMKLNNCKGYLVIKLSGEANRRDFRVNRLVAEHFIHNIEDKPEVNHIDEIKTNNQYWNLEWCSRIENVNHGTVINRMALTKSTPIIQTKLNGEFVREWVSARQAARKLGYSNSSIYAAINGKYKQAYGFKWYKAA